jgi:hypothetical protein
MTKCGTVRDRIFKPDLPVAFAAGVYPTTALGDSLDLIGNGPQSPGCEEQVTRGQKVTQDDSEGHASRSTATMRNKMQCCEKLLPHLCIDGWRPLGENFFDVSATFGRGAVIDPASLKRISVREP